MDETYFFSKCQDFKKSERQSQHMRQLVYISLLPIITRRFTCSTIKKSHNMMDMVVGLILDTKLKFNEYLGGKINKCYRIIGSIK